jgi:dTDP-4-dehydrorhamnose reductase
MKILLLGSSGYVGSWVHQYMAEQGHEVVEVRCDVIDRESVKNALQTPLSLLQNPLVTSPLKQGRISGEKSIISSLCDDVVLINATGKTGVPNVDWCEDHQEETYSVNVTGALNVAEVCRDLGLYMIQIGSGCIFAGDESTPFTEDDEPNFFGSYYSQTKGEVEMKLREYDNVCVLRIRIPIQGSSSPKNLIDKLLKYDKIVDIPNSVTIMEDFMPFVEKVCERKITGVLNATNSGLFKHSMLLELYREIVDPSRSFEYVSGYDGLDLKAKRSNCVLSSKKCEELGIAMPEISGRLREVVESYKASI